MEEGRGATGAGHYPPLAAWEAARATALALMASDPGRQNVWIASSFEVTDQDGAIVFEFPFVEAIDVKGDLN
jgi:Domain of unknown function (DUF6894)